MNIENYLKVSFTTLRMLKIDITYHSDEKKIYG